MKDHGINQQSVSGVFHESKSNENETDDQGNESEPITPERPHRESSGNIPAATAIAGHVTASDDLPYITAPAHFSGDSQDSGSKEIVDYYVEIVEYFLISFLIL